MATSDTSSAGTSANGETSSGLSPRQLLLAVYCVTVAVAAVVGLTLVTVFHYSTSTDAASVLGVVIPVFTAVIGVAVGGGAGAAAGSAGKKAAQKETASARTKLAAAKLLTAEVSKNYEQHAELLTTSLPSGPASRFLTTTVNGEAHNVADSTKMTEISRQLGYLEGILE